MGNLDGYGGFISLVRYVIPRRELFYQTTQLHRILRDGIFELNFHLLTMCSWTGRSLPLGIYSSMHRDCLSDRTFGQYLSIANLMVVTA